MSEHEIDVFGIKLGSQAYNELISPAARALGSSLGKLASIVDKAVEATLFVANISEDAARHLKARVLLECAKRDICRPVDPQPILLRKAVAGYAVSFDQDELRSLYVRLIARAMDETCSNSVHPAFVSVLNDFSPADALSIRSLHGFDEGQKIIECVMINQRPAREQVPIYIQWRNMCRKVGISDEDVADVSLDVMIRNGIVLRETSYHSHSTPGTMVDEINRNYVNKHIDTLRMSSFGSRFVSLVCTDGEKSPNKSFETNGST
ncbi:MAG: Abi-alpha family protein [Planctomycetota bacterium]|jgi:hypothetical protein|nr:Abi-alpha family protein [Planctomycetota bacterium]